MTNDENDLEKVVLTRLLRLNATVQGFGHRTIAGLVVIHCHELGLYFKGGYVVGPHSLSPQSILHRVRSNICGKSDRIFAYGFGCGFIGGYLVARMYNWIAGLR